MKIQTTINVNNRVLDKINYASNILKISRTDVIRILLKRFLDDRNKVRICESPVKYQPRDDNVDWSTFHLCLRQDEYELYLDLKKVYKMSVSFIVAYAVKKYLFKIIQLLENATDETITDNYLFHNYLFCFQETNGVKILKIYWGITNFEGIITDNYQNTV
ncbi:MAG: hypothetical protein JXA07_05145 [Spirochaetes bacterium]|nr:hypothetical protein [Spirochaetota bacterium]